MKTLMSLLNTLLEKTLILAMAAIVITVSWQVFSRFILESPSSFTEELSRFLLIWIGILGAAYAYKTKAHLGLDLFVDKVPEKYQKMTRIVTELAVLVFASSVMIYGGLSLVMITLELKQTSATLGLNMALVYSVIPIAGVLMVLFSFDHIKKIYSQLDNKGE